MFNTITEFSREFEVACGPSKQVFLTALQQYELSLIEFIKVQFCKNEPFDKLYERCWRDALDIYGCGADNLTEVMVLEHIIYEFMWPLEECHNKQDII